MPIPFEVFVFLVWLPFFLLSVIFVFFEKTRPVVPYVFLVPTSALLLAFPLAKAVFYVVLRTAPQSHLAACPLCVFIWAGLFGAIASYFVLKKLLQKYNVPQS